MKHERDIRPEGRPNWRLKKTLGRHVEIRPIESADLKYLWAAYKKGALAAMGEEFASGAMSSEEFSASFHDTAERYSEAWTVIASTRRGMMPVGVIFGSLAPLAAYLVISGAVWFPWASRRNIIEGTVAFLNAIRKQAPAMLYARDEHKRLYEIACMHGIIRRVGTSHIVFPGQSAAVFETRITEQ